MKRIKTIYTLLLAVALTLLTACTVGDETTENGTEQKDGKVTVRFRVSQAAPAITRAADEWEDKDNAEDKEMMNVWTVIAVENTDDKVVGIWTCKPKGKPDQEVDDINEIKAKLNENTSYRFYSFANMGASYLSKLLFSNADIITDPTEDNKIVEKTNLGDLKLTETQMNAITVKVEGNGFNKFTENDDNGFGYYGIPMSNVQTFNSLNNDDIKDLIVIRMLAKIKLQIYNDSGEDITINSVTLTSLTANTKEGDGNYKNLMLLPKLTKGQDTMESNDGYHGDIKPNLYENPEQVEYTYTPSENQEIGQDKTLANNKPVEYVFYVNESATPNLQYVPDDLKNNTDNSYYKQDYSHFFLKINMIRNGNLKEERYTLIGDAGKTYSDENKDEWNYIARNDYRIIPIVLDDYKLDMIPYDFPAIGVYPASVKEEDGIYTINFHDYGHFHLVPQVTRYSDGSVVDFTAITPTSETYSSTSWGLVNNSFGSSWGAWTDATKTTIYNNSTEKFYRTSTDTEDADDADDAGGVPIWYKNDGTDGPQWSPDGENYPPFIFGYIADPDEKPTPDKKVYHEFSINLYKDGSSAARQMTYRLYMILDQDQMLYRSRSKTAPVSKCTHHCHERW